MEPVQLITVKEAAPLLGFDNVKRLYDAVQKRLVPSIRIGRRVRFDPKALAEWAAKGGTSLADVQKEEARTLSG
jgi:excisionase family DNA binding protein